MPICVFHVLKKNEKKTPNPYKTSRKPQKISLWRVLPSKRSSTKRFRKDESQLLAWGIGIRPSKSFVFLFTRKSDLRPWGHTLFPFCCLQTETMVLVDYGRSSWSRSWARCSGTCSPRWALRCVHGSALLVTLCHRSLLPSWSRNKVEGPTKTCRHRPY